MIEWSSHFSRSAGICSNSSNFFHSFAANYNICIFDRAISSAGLKRIHWVEQTCNHIIQAQEQFSLEPGQSFDYWADLTKHRKTYDLPLDSGKWKQTWSSMTVRQDTMKVQCPDKARSFLLSAMQKNNNQCRVHDLWSRKRTKFPARLLVWIWLAFWLSRSL